jgi:lysophospholipase L1-like esterase
MTRIILHWIVIFSSLAAVGGAHTALAQESVKPEQATGAQSQNAQGDGSSVAPAIGDSVPGAIVQTPLPVGQTLDATNFRIDWQVVNRFRLFRNASAFRLHEIAWRQYLLHVDGLGLDPDTREAFIAKTSVLGSEHVLNDRRIAFSSILRSNFDWRGWAAKLQGATCYDSDRRDYSACGGIDSYLNPTSHQIELWLTATGAVPLPADKRCEWHIGDQIVATAPCDQHVSGPSIALPYPGGADISVNVVGEHPVTLSASVHDLLIAGLGDSFASGEGNPDQPVAFSDSRRYRNLYPVRMPDDVSGSAQWTDELCHRSMYGQQFRAALQIAVENRQAAVTFLDFSCSGAAVDEGILGPQSYVERRSEADVTSQPLARPLSGGSRDGELYRLLHTLCVNKPEESDGSWQCPKGAFRRHLDFVFLSIGGNDIGFSNEVAWATLRAGVSSAIASFFGATVSAREFVQRSHDDLPDAYARLAKAIEIALPLYSAGDKVFDSSRVILTAYPDIVTDETGSQCAASGDSPGPEDQFAANQSLDMFSSWLIARNGRLTAVRTSIAGLFDEMKALAGDHGWTFAGHVYADHMFDGHGFCARNPKMVSDPAEILMIPCWGKAPRDTATCEQSWSGKARDWRPYNPASQNYPYALRQRWVRSFNDAYMVINQKVIDRSGQIDEKASQGVFSETTGALHPTAEGHAVMADALLLSVRPMIRDILQQQVSTSPLN